MNLAELDILEDSIIEEYRKNLAHIVKNLSNAEFKWMLLQRKWTSYAFTPLYDFGIDSIANEKIKTILREIRNDEYPPNMPSHREDLIHDLKLIGIEFDEIINSSPTKITTDAIKKQFDFLKIREEQELHDIKVAAFLRFGLEVLVSVEYSVFVERLEDFGLNRRNSKFYWPHYMHDMKQNPLGREGRTHSDMLSRQLSEMLDTIKKVSFCSKATVKAYELRSKFFEQNF